MEYDQFPNEVRLTASEPDAVPAYMWDDDYYDDPEQYFEKKGISE